MRRYPSLRSADRAACQPAMPCTPPPGGVAAEQRKIPGSGVAYGSNTRRLGRVNSWPQVEPAAGDVAAHVVRVVRLELRRG